MQLPIFPLQITRTEPSPMANQSAICKQIGKCQDGYTYFLKTIAASPHIPASEYICTKMAEAVGLNVPYCTIAKMPTGELAFASQNIEPLLSPHTSIEYMLDNAPSLAPELAAWYAFDQFVGNHDRHIGNFIIKTAPGISATLFGIDFSHALLEVDWPSRRTPTTPCNTTRTMRNLAGQENYPPADCVKLVHKLATLPDTWLQDTLTALPDAWVGAMLRREIACWWRKHRHKRLHTLRKHLANERYFRVFADPRRS